MLNKFYKLFLKSSAGFFAFTAVTILSSTSQIFHGEVDCPSELLK